MPLIEYKGNQKLDYTYDANGTRISKTVGKNTTYYTHGVSGNAEMETIIGTSSTTSRYYIWGLDHLGHITSAMHYYYLKDHLGSIRMTVNNNGKVVSYNDYYPYGSIMPMRSMNMAMADERYKFIGKEQDAETGYDWFGVRGYNSLGGSFLVVDPLASSMPGWSPYQYTFDNPIRLKDPSGMGPDDIPKGFMEFLNAVWSSIGKHKKNQEKPADVGNTSVDPAEVSASAINTLNSNVDKTIEDISTIAKRTDLGLTVAAGTGAELDENTKANISTSAQWLLKNGPTVNLEGRVAVADQTLVAVKESLPSNTTLTEIGQIKTTAGGGGRGIDFIIPCTPIGPVRYQGINTSEYTQVQATVGIPFVGSNIQANVGIVIRYSWYK